MQEKADDTKRGKIIITTNDAIGRPVAMPKGDWTDEIEKLASGELIELRLAVYPIGIETNLPMGIIKFRREVDAEPRPSD